jgi:hypothetical protein
MTPDEENLSRSHVSRRVPLRNDLGATFHGERFGARCTLPWMWIASAVRKRTVVLAEEIRRFIDKHDYQRRGELAGEEAEECSVRLGCWLVSDRRLFRMR